MLHEVTPDGQARPANRAEQAAAAYRAEALPSRPTAARSATGRANWRAWLLAGACGLLLGVAGTLAAVDQWAPLADARQVRNAIVTTQADGADWFLVAGWAVPIPKAEASPVAGQP